MLRLTYDIGPNEHRLSDYMVKAAGKIGEAMQPSHLGVFGLPKTFDAGAGYGVIHQVGGAMMGSSPDNSVVNKYLQSWDVPNLFVVGASAFPPALLVQSDGAAGALAYHTADAIKSKYLRSPGPLI